MVSAEEISQAQVGDLILTRAVDKVGGLPYLLTKLPHKMSERGVFRSIPHRVLALVLGRHHNERFQNYLLVLCDDFIGWLPPDCIERFLARSSQVQIEGPSE